MKRLAIGLLVIVLLGLLAALIAPFVIDLNNYKGEILAQVRPYVPREVDFQRVELSILTGLGVDLKGLRVADRPGFSQEDFLTLESLQLRVRVLPLLRRRIQVKKVVLLRPVVRIERDRQGAFSFEDLLPATPAAPPATGEGKPGPGADGTPGVDGLDSSLAAAEEKPAAAAEASKASPLLAGLLVNELVIRGGKILYSDEALFHSTEPLVVDDLDLRVSDLSLTRPVQLELAMNLFDVKEQNLRLEGRVGPVGESLRWPDTPLDLRIAFEEIPADRLAERVPVRLPFSIQAGTMKGELSAAGAPARFSAEARADLSNLGIEYEGVLNKPAGTELTIRCGLDRQGDRLSFRDLALSLPPLELSGSGEAVLGEPLRFDFQAQTNTVPLEGLESLLPLLAPYGPRGSLLLRASARGTTEEMSADLQTSSDRIALRLPAQEGKGGTAGAPREAVLEALQLETQAGKKAERIEAAGKVALGRGEARGAVFEDLRATFRYGDDRIEISGLDLKAFGGSIRANAGYQLKDGSWSLDPDVTGLQAGALLNAMTQYRDLFTGTFSGRLQVRGRAAQGVDPMQALAARGSFRLSQGEIRNFDFVGTLVEGLFGVKGLSGLLQGARGDIRRHESTRFEWLEGPFALDKQTLRLEKLELHNVATSKATDADAVLQGTAALDTGLLDLEGKVILSQRHSKELASQAEVLEALFNEQGRLVLPVTLKGTIRKPAPFLDTDYVVGAITRHYARQGLRKGLDTLRDELGLPKEQDKGGGGEGEKPIEKLLKDLLKK